MLAEGEYILLEYPFVSNHEFLPFFHEFKPQCFRILQADEELYTFKNLILQFYREE